MWKVLLSLFGLLLACGTAMAVGHASTVDGSASPPLDSREAPPVVEAVLSEFDVDYLVIGQSVGKLYGIEDLVYGGRYVICGDEVRILDERSLEVDTLYTESACSIAVDDIRNRAYVDDGPNGILVLDGATNRVLTTIPTGGSVGGAVATDPRLGRIYSAEGYGIPTTFDVIDATTYQTIASSRLFGEQERHFISAHLGDGFVFAGGRRNGRLSIRDAETGVEYGYIQDGGVVYSAQYSAKHDEIWALSWIRVRVYDVHTQALVHVKRIDDVGLTIRIDERRDRAYVYALGYPGKAYLWEFDADTRETIQKVTLGNDSDLYFPTLALNARAGRLYAIVNGVEKRLIVFDLRRSDRATAVAELSLASGISVATNPWNGRVYVYGRGPTTVVFDRIAWLRNRLALIDELAAAVSALGLHHGMESSLLAKLDAASLVLGDLQEDNDHAAANLLGAFINALRAQRGKKITAEDADALTEAAQEVIELLRGTD